MGAAISGAQFFSEGQSLIFPLPFTDLGSILGAPAQMPGPLRESKAVGSKAGPSGEWMPSAL